MEKYYLRWKSFVSNVTNTFSNLRTDNEFYDVTLVGDDRALVPAHKLVLSSSSDYFKNIMKQNQGLTGQLVVCLEGVSFSEINNMLDYIYNGEVEISEESLGKFLKIAQRFKLEGLLQDNDNMNNHEESFASSQILSDVDNETERFVIDNQNTQTEEYPEKEFFMDVDQVNQIVLEEKNTIPLPIQKLSEVKKESNRLTSNLNTFHDENLTENAKKVKSTCEDYDYDTNLEEEQPTTIENQPQNEKEYLRKKIGMTGLNRNVEFCPDVFESLEAFDERIKSLYTRTGKSSFKCSLCPLTTQGGRITQMKQHIEIHLQGQHFSCSVCGKRFRTRESARQHVYRRHEEK